jgi:DNA repair exonuclease SbcCD ATPase subunit
MAEQARVSSIEALEALRATLIVFLERAYRSLDEVFDEIRRTRSWVQQDQRHHWELELRKRNRALDAAEQELLTARLSNLRDNIKHQQDMVRKAKAAVADGEEKLRNTKLWTRDFPHEVDPLARRLEGLRHYLDHDLPKAIAYLLQAQQTLAGYAEISATPPAPPPLVP